MLTQLFIKNYALIEELNLSLEAGFTGITGETGAGKSILLGALGLVLGKRADINTLRHPDDKCVVEAHFQLSNALEAFFDEYALDFDTHTILRREILPSGKSRAFINDTPATLNIINQLAGRLIDVHSQHETLLLSDTTFQMQLLDGFAKNQKLLGLYSKDYQELKKTENLLEELTNFAAKEAGDSDYLQFLFEELEEAHLKANEFEALEEEHNILSRTDEIEQKLSTSVNVLFAEETGALDAITLAAQHLTTLANVGHNFKNLAERTQAVRIELDDMRHELEKELENLSADPLRAGEVSARMSKIMALQKKHQVDNVSELLQKKDTLEEKVDALNSIESRIKAVSTDLHKKMEVAQASANELTKTRKTAAQLLADEIAELLTKLNMTSAKVELRISKTEKFSSFGQDKLEFYFSANAGQPLQALSKVASGGELSRVMLAIKAIMAKTQGLPTIIFDEIDSGVSGETAGKIGDILKNMGADMQVIAITHLPQIAAKAATHLKVQKTENEGQTRTNLFQLTSGEREQELARLLSGAKISDAALTNARELLG